MHAASKQLMLCIEIDIKPNVQIICSPFLNILISYQSSIALETIFPPKKEMDFFTPSITKMLNQRSVRTRTLKRKICAKDYTKIGQPFYFPNDFTRLLTEHRYLRMLEIDCLKEH